MNRDINRDTKPRRKTSPVVVHTRARVLTDNMLKRMREGTKASDGAVQKGHGRLVAWKRGGVVKFYYRDGDSFTALGAYDAMSLPSARDKVRELIDVRMKGGDPRVHVEKQALAREQADREHADQGSFGDMLDAYTEALEGAGKTSAREVKTALQRHVVKAFPRLVRRKASDVRPEDIADILRKMTEAKLKRKANMVRSYLHAAFARGLKADNKWTGPKAQHRRYRLEANPVGSVPREAAFDRALDRVLDDDEVKGYVAALEAREDPIAAALLIALLLGGQRLAQLLRVTWADYDAGAGTLRLRDTKGRGGARVHVLPVSKRVAARLPRKLSVDGPIFTTDGKVAIHGSTLSTDVTSIAKPLAKPGVEPFTHRDVRRTVETRLAKLGVSRDMRAQVLSHGLQRGVQERHYDRHDYVPEKAAALALWEKHLDDLKKPPPAAPETKKAKAKLRLVA